MSIKKTTKTPTKKKEKRRSAGKQPRAKTVTHIDVPATGVEIVLDNGLTIYVYNSLVEPDKRVVVELETDGVSDTHNPGTLMHDEDGRPQMKVMINEAVISNDGGEQPVTQDPNNEPHIVMAGNLSEGFKAIGPFNSFDDAADCHEAQEYSWVMSLESTAQKKKRG